MKNIMHYNKYFMILCLLLAFLFMNTVSNAQNTNLIRNPDNGHIYELVFVPEGIDWYTANNAAQGQTFGSSMGYLATITSQDENNFIFNNIEPLISNCDGDACGVWIGGTRDTSQPPPNLGWGWVTGEPFIFTNWDVADGEPDTSVGAPENCISFAPNGLWDADDCLNTEHQYYLIEFEPSPNPIPTLSQWGFVALAGFLAMIGLFVAMRRRKATA